MAPEQIEKKAYENSVDIWSIGITLYVMTVGKLPFDDEDINNILDNFIIKYFLLTNFLLL